MIPTGVPRSSDDTTAMTGLMHRDDAEQRRDTADSTVSRRSCYRPAGIHQSADQTVRGMRSSNVGEGVGYRSTRDEYRRQIRRLAGTPRPFRPSCRSQRAPSGALRPLPVGDSRRVRDGVNGTARSTCGSEHLHCTEQLGRMAHTSGLQVAELSVDYIARCATLAVLGAASAGASCPIRVSRRLPASLRMSSVMSSAQVTRCARSPRSSICGP